MHTADFEEDRRMRTPISRAAIEAAERITGEHIGMSDTMVAADIIDAAMEPERALLKDALDVLDLCACEQVGHQPTIRNILRRAGRVK